MAGKSFIFRRLRATQSPIVSIRQDLSSPAAAAASAVASSPVSASSCRHTFGIYHKCTESCFLAVRCQRQYVLTPIQMHYAVSDVVLQQEAHV